ncbi:MAG: hypothetical protein M3P29_09100 [Acidobacteriota bacterium]|nr:hypothetical protein [Acidobacteriota bacterium]
MRNLFPVLPAVLLIAAACASTTPPQTAQPVAQQPQPEPAATRPMTPGSVPIPARGLSCKSAIAVDATNEREGIARENAWIAENYPGAKKGSQALTSCNDKPVDQVDIETANGQKVSIFFDISKFSKVK